MMLIIKKRTRCLTPFRSNYTTFKETSTYWQIWVGLTSPGFMEYQYSLMSEISVVQWMKGQERRKIAAQLREKRGFSLNPSEKSMKRLHLLRRKSSLFSELTMVELSSKLLHFYIFDNKLVVTFRLAI